MTERFIFCISLLVLVLSCIKEEEIPQDTSLQISLTASSSELRLGEPLTVDIDVKNADSLFALSFELHYGPAIFETETIIAGDLFIDPFLPINQKFLSDGEVPVVLGELDSIQGSANGRACSIILTSEAVGTDFLYIRSLNMIKEGGSHIDGFNTLSVEPIEVKVLQ